MEVSTASKITTETCKVVWEVLQDKHISKPNYSMWRETAACYWTFLTVKEVQVENILQLSAQQTATHNATITNNIFRHCFKL
jgi:hypothetical protein